MQYLVWPCDFTRPLSPWGKAAPVSWLSHLLRRSPLPSQQGKLYVKIFRTHVYLTSPTLPSYPYLGLVTKGACQPTSRSAQGLLQNVQREDEEVNVRRENTGHALRQTTGGSGGIPEHDSRIWHCPNTPALRLPLGSRKCRENGHSSGKQQAHCLSDAHGYQATPYQCCQDSLLPTDHLKQWSKVKFKNKFALEGAPNSESPGAWHLNGTVGTHLLQTGECND